MGDAVARVNQVVRGWVNYFRGSNASRTFSVIRAAGKKKVRRFAMKNMKNMKKRKRNGFGWRWQSSAVVYGTWGLFDDYQVRYG